MYVEILHGAEIDEHSLHHHRSAAENFHINVHYQADQPHQRPLGPGILLGHGYGLYDANQKTDETAYDRAHNGDEQGLSHADQKRLAVMRQQVSYPAPIIGG